MIPYLLYQTGAPAEQAGFTSILAPWAGGAGATVAPPTPSPVVGGLVRKRKTQTLEEFEAGQPKPFGRKWFAEFKAAEEAVRQASQAIPNQRQRAGLTRALKAAENTRAEVELSPFVPDLGPLIAALHAAAVVQSIGHALKASQDAVEEARRVVEELRAHQEDDEEAIMMLLH